MSLNQSFNIALNSMQNNQYALSVVAHNIANLHTSGYQRQRVDFEENRFNPQGDSVIAQIRALNGASLKSLTNYFDEGAFNGVLEANSDSQYYNTMLDNLSELEDVANDLGDDGLNGLLNDFFTACASLEQFPSDLTVRQQYTIALENVCDKFNSIANRYQSIKEDKMQSLDESIENVNSLLDKLAQANKTVMTTNNSQAAQNELNQVLEELSNYMEVNTTKNSNGTVDISLGGIKVVTGAKQTYKVNVIQNAGDPDNAVKFELQSIENPDYKIDKGLENCFKTGSIKAYTDFLTGSNNKVVNINDMQKALDIAASSFADALNAIQHYDKTDAEGNRVFAASITQDGDGNLILQEPPVKDLLLGDAGGISASSIKVNSEIIKDPYKISAARIDSSKYPSDTADIDPSWVKSIGNADNAIQMTKMQNEKICKYDNGNKATLSQYLISNAGKNAIDLANIESKADTCKDILDNAVEKFSNITGVNLDEELSDMIRYQRAYEASARIFSTVNSLYDTLLSMV